MNDNLCNNCNNILRLDFNNNIAMRYCESCGTKYNRKPSDSLVYEKTKESNVTIFKKILDGALDDPVTIKARVQCPKCDNDIVKQVLISEDMNLFNICTKCKHKWLN